MALFLSIVPANWGSTHKDRNTEAAQWNSAIIKCIFHTYCMFILLHVNVQIVHKKRLNNYHIYIYKLALAHWKHEGSCI